jgi:prepilin-type N-terminal cleavage/methylation domain-containing protein
VIQRLRTLRLEEERGYSLIEMLTVMVIMSIVFAGVTAVFVAGSKAQAEQDRRFQAQLTTRLALDKIRRDIHCASDVTPYATNSVTLKISGCTGGDISWCTVAVSGYTNRFALYRKAGTSCSASGATKIADYLTTASAFPAFAHTSGCGCLASLQVAFKVSIKGSATVGVYDLVDTIYLRNSTRI